MYHKQKKYHQIELLFIICLFFLFAFLAALLILLGSSMYQKTNNQMELHFAERNVSSYIIEKVHQNDTADSIVISSLQDIEALKMYTTINDTKYATYLYVYNDYLYELFTRDDLQLLPEDGQKIMPLHSIHFQLLTDSLLEFSYSDNFYSDKKVYIALHTKQADT